MLIEIIADPCNHFNLEPEILAEPCGVLIEWSVYALRAEDTLKELKEFYQFPSPRMDGYVDPETGVYLYPDDPPLYPLLNVRNKQNNKNIFLYRHAMIAVKITDSEYYMMRMD